MIAVLESNKEKGQKILLKKIEGYCNLFFDLLLERAGEGGSAGLCLNVFIY